MKSWIYSKSLVNIIKAPQLVLFPLFVFISTFSIISKHFPQRNIFRCIFTACLFVIPSFLRKLNIPLLLLTVYFALRLKTSIEELIWMVSRETQNLRSLKRNKTCKLMLCKWFVGVSVAGLGLHPRISRMFSWVYHFCCAALINNSKPRNFVVRGWSTFRFKSLKHKNCVNTGSFRKTGSNKSSVKIRGKWPFIRSIRRMWLLLSVYVLMWNVDGGGVAAITSHSNP